MIVYILKSVAVSGILYAWYALALRNKRLHKYNRYFLLFTLYASLQIPLLHFNWPVAPQQSAVVASVQAALHLLDVADAASPAPASFTTTGAYWQPTAIGLVAAVSLALLSAMLLRIGRIVRKGRQYPATIMHGVTLIHTDLPNAPFSFMNRIYWRNDIPTSTPGGRLILQHELAHIQQKHTYDKLIGQTLTCIFWMNPFYWLIQKELSMVHEFLADEQAIVNNAGDMQDTDYAAAFARMLLQAHHRAAALAPEHQFFSSPIKRRLTMLQTSKTVRASALRRAAALPIIAGSIFICSFHPRNAATSAPVKSENKILLMIDAGHGGSDKGCHAGELIEKDLSLKVAKRLQQLAPDYNIDVRLTRNADQTLSLEERVAMTNKLQPDDFLSIHIDDQPGNETGNGTFGIAINTKNAKADDSKRLAYAIYKHAARPEWEQKKAFAEKGPLVLRATATAAAILELGDIKNYNQMQYIQDDAKLTDLCSHILQGVVEAHSK